jgi:hypothetical protein
MTANAGDMLARALAARFAGFAGQARSIPSSAAAGQASPSPAPATA